MSTTLILATADLELMAAWERQVPPGHQVVRLSSLSVSTVSLPGMASVLLLDAAVAERLPAALEKCVTIFIGEPHSLPFEQARLNGRAKLYFSYEESRERLREVLPLVEDLAEKQSMVDLLWEKQRRLDAARPATRPSTWSDAPEVWDFLEGAVENLDSRERLLGEFRRASRYLLRASHAVFFLREADGFRADRGTSFCTLDDPLVAFFERSPAVVDGTHWSALPDPVAELAAKNRLAMWGARMIAPVHDNGHLLGMIALGVRDDGQPYEEADRARVVCIARLLRQFLVKSAQVSRLQVVYDQHRLGAKYLPDTLILAADEPPPRHVPLVVRALIGEVRRVRDVRRVAPTLEQPFRASAGLIAETGGVWAVWQEASGEVHDRAQQQKAERFHLLRELALTLNHELGNALTSLSTLRQIESPAALPPPMFATVCADIAKLAALNQRISLLQSFRDYEPRLVDLRTLLQAIREQLSIRAEPGPTPVMLSVSAKLLEFALISIVETVAENRPDLGLRDLVLELRSTGENDDLTALLSLKGQQLELEGILPEPSEDSAPSQGRIGIFIAKEILRLHRGEIHAGPGLEGTEILISLRHL